MGDAGPGENAPSANAPRSQSQRVGPLSHENMQRHGRGDSIKMHSQGYHGSIKKDVETDRVERGDDESPSRERVSPRLNLDESKAPGSPKAERSVYRPKYRRAQTGSTIDVPAPDLSGERTSLDRGPVASSMPLVDSDQGSPKQARQSPHASVFSKSSMLSRLPDMDPHHAMAEVTPTSPPLGNSVGFSSGDAGEGEETKTASIIASTASGSLSQGRRFLIEGLAPPTAQPVIPLVSIPGVLAQIPEPVGRIRPTTPPRDGGAQQSAQEQASEANALLSYQSQTTSSEESKSEAHEKPKQETAVMPDVLPSGGPGASPNERTGRGSPPPAPQGALPAPPEVNVDVPHSVASPNPPDTPTQGDKAKELVQYSDKTYFERVLHDPVGIFKFGQYVKALGQVNDLVFWLNVDQHKMEMRRLQDFENRIADLHIAENATLDLQLTAEERAACEAMRRQETERNSPFDKIQERLFEKMYNDHWLNFLQYRMAIIERRKLRDNVDAGELAVSGLGDCYCLADGEFSQDNPILLASDGFIRLTGYTRSEVISQNCRFLQGPLTNQVEVDKVRDAVKNGTEICKLLLNYRKDGEPFWNLLLLIPLKKADGTTRFLMSGQIDVTSNLIRGSNLDFLLEDENDVDVDDEAPILESKARSLGQGASSSFGSMRSSAEQSRNRLFADDPAAPYHAPQSPSSQNVAGFLELRGLQDRPKDRQRRENFEKRRRAEHSDKIWRLLYGIGQEPFSTQSVSTTSNTEYPLPQLPGASTDSLGTAGTNDAGSFEPSATEPPLTVIEERTARQTESVNSDGSDRNPESVASSVDVPQATRVFTETYSRYVVFDPYNFQILFVSRWLSDAYIIGQSILECLKTTNPPSIVKAVHRACNAGKSLSVDVTIIKKLKGAEEGSPQHYSYGGLHITPLRDGQGRIGAFVGVFG